MVHQDPKVLSSNEGGDQYISILKDFKSLKESEYFFLYSLIGMSDINPINNVYLSENKNTILKM